MTNSEVSTYNEWKERFKPSPVIYQKENNNLDFVKSQDPRKVWTWIDDGEDTLVNGFVDVESGWYYICENLWDESKDYKIVITVKVQCECYDEDGYETGNGYKNCIQCEGTGYHRQYVEA
jgi:hypothetical protein